MIKYKPWQELSAQCAKRRLSLFRLLYLLLPSRVKVPTQGVMIVHPEVSNPQIGNSHILSNLTVKWFSGITSKTWSTDIGCNSRGLNQNLIKKLNFTHFCTEVTVEYKSLPMDAAEMTWGWGHKYWLHRHLRHRFLLRSALCLSLTISNAPLFIFPRILPWMRYRSQLLAWCEVVYCRQLLTRKRPHWSIAQ